MSDEEKRLMWLRVGAEPDLNSSVMATAMTAVIIAAALIMFLTVQV